MMCSVLYSKIFNKNVNTNYIQQVENLLQEHSLTRKLFKFITFPCRKTSTCLKLEAVQPIFKSPSPRPGKRWLNGLN